MRFIRFRVRRVRRRRPASASSKRDYAENKDAALALVRQKVAHFATIYGAEYHAVAVRNQRTRWGSCSRKGNLNFNWRILLLPESVQDYLIVHEVCHLKEFNHSRQFWLLVAQTVPNHRAIRRQLKTTRMK